MREGFVLVRFKDKPFPVKIAPLDLVRNADDKMPFAPASSEDFVSGGTVQVKWQSSVCNGSFSCDGYYDAEIYAIGSK